MNPAIRIGGVLLFQGVVDRGERGPCSVVVRRLSLRPIALAMIGAAMRYIECSTDPQGCLRFLIECPRTHPSCF